MRRSLDTRLAAVVAVLLAIPSNAADVESALGSNVVGGVELTPGTRVQVSVIRDGVVVATASDVPVGADGTFAVNTAGGPCFAPITPKLRPGDSVQVSGPDVALVVDVHDLEITSVRQGPGAAEVTVEARSRDADGQPLIFARVRLWADGSFREGLVTEPNPGELVAVFALESPQVAALAAEQAIAEVVWEDPFLPGAISVGQAPGLPGAAPGCPAFAELAVSAVLPPVIGIADAPAVAITGTATPHAQVQVTVRDGAGNTAGPALTTATETGAWSVSDVDVSTLQSGPLHVAVESVPTGGSPELGVPGSAVLDLVRPALDGVVLNGGVNLTRELTVPLEVFARDVSPSSGLFVAVAPTLAELDLVLPVPLAGPLSFALPEEGSRSACVRVFDGAGNTGTADLCAPITVDRTPPVFSNYSPPNGATVTGPVGASVTLSDAHGIDSGSLSAHVDGVATTASFSAGVLTVPNLGPGLHSVSVSARDLAGNEGTTLWSFTVGDPDLPPALVVKLPRSVGAYWYGHKIAVRAEASDDVGIALLEFWSGTSLLKRTSRDSYTFYWRPSSPGRQTLTVVATDTSGQQTRKEVSVFICDPHQDYCFEPQLPADGTPWVQLITPNEDTRVRRYNTTELNAAADSTRPITEITFLVNGQVIRTDTRSPYQAWWKPTKQGWYLLEARATDADGRTASDTYRVWVR